MWVSYRVVFQELLADCSSSQALGSEVLFYRQSVKISSTHLSLKDREGGEGNSLREKFVLRKPGDLLSKTPVDVSQTTSAASRGLPQYFVLSVAHA